MFINFYNTENEALSVTESVANLHLSYSGVQLLPNQTNSYTQITNTTNGIELEDWQVFAVNLRTGVKTDITSSFSIFNNFFDKKGNPQIIFQLTNLPDLGYDFVYLEANQLLGETYYSNIFKITAYKANRTSRFDYRDKKTDIWESIQLNTWFRQTLNRDELTTYYEVSTKQTVAVTIKEATAQKYFTDIVNIDILKKFRDLINKRYKYIDLKYCNLFEAFEIPELSQNQNFGQQSYLLNIKEDDLLTENINEMGVLEDIAYLKAVLKPVTDGGVIWIWDKPANEIPEGYAEETNIAGKTIIGRLELDPDFGTLGQTGGSKTVSLVEANIPQHDHRMFVSKSANIATNRINLFPDRYATYRGTGEGSADHDYTISSSTTEPTLGKTGAFGQSTPTAVDKLNPYRVVNFIKWVGLP